MNEARIETHFDRGARILNAVLAEVDVSADIKETAQSVIGMLADLLPRLLVPPAPAPAPAPTEPEIPANADSAQIHQEALSAAFDATVAGARVDRPARVKTARPGRAAKPRTGDDAAPTSRPLMAPPEVHDTDARLIWNAYEMVQGLQRRQAEQLSAALFLALRAQMDPARMVEILIAASNGETRIWRAALDDLARA